MEVRLEENKMMRDFTKEDWMAYSGAEKFSDGSEPMVGEYGPIIIVVDRYEVSIEALDENTMFVLDGIEDNKEYKQDIAERVLSEVKGKTPIEVRKLLIGLGFEYVM